MLQKKALATLEAPPPRLKVDALATLEALTTLEL